MNEDKITVNILDGEKHLLEIRHGDALPLKEPKVVNLEGSIETVSRFLKIRADRLDQKTCHLIVDIEKGCMTLFVDETNPYAGKVSGKIVPDPVLQSFGINTGKRYSLRDLSDFLKMRRSYFADVSEAMKLVTELRNFKAKVNKEMEKVSDNRGNSKIMLDQVVDSNVPEGFVLHVPLIKGSSRFRFKVDINIIPTDADMICMLESVDLKELEDETYEKYMEYELEQIHELAPDIVIINQ